MKRGYVYSILSAILFGSAGLVVKLAFLEGIDPVSLLTVQYIIAVTLMFAIILIFSPSSLKIRGRDICHLAVLGIIGNTFMTVFYYKAYRYLPMAMVTILLYTYPIMVFLYTFLFKKARIKLNKILALVLAFTGCILALNILNSGMSYSKIGILYGLLSALFYCFMNIYSENHMYNIEALTINAYSTFFSLIALLIYRFPFFLFKEHLSFGLLSYTAILAVFCEIIPLTLMYAAIKHIGSLKASIIGNIETPTAMLLSFFVLREQINFLQVIGAALVFYAVYMIRK